MVAWITAAAGLVVLIVGFLLLRRSWQKDQAARHSRRKKRT
jgi:uncharacterized membrane-anchored protein YhcB (DUF1043 family)